MYQVKIVCIQNRLGVRSHNIYCFCRNGPKHREKQLPEEAYPSQRLILVHKITCHCSLCCRSFVTGE